VDGYSNRIRHQGGGYHGIIRHGGEDFGGGWDGDGSSGCADQMELLVRSQSSEYSWLGRLGAL
jgi:hypothetical protein